MKATLEGENEANILTSSCFKKKERRKEKPEQNRTAKRIN